MTTVADQDPGTEPTTDQDPRAEDLTDEITRKYDPERLLRMIGKRAGKGEALEHSVRNKYEQRFGVDLGHVRLYSGEFAEEFNKQRNAHAVTVGSTGIILMGGSADKGMAGAAGQALLAHELTHVAQAQRKQGGGLYRKGVTPMAFTEEHEAEAEHHEAEVHGEGANGRSATTASANAAQNKVAAAAKIEEALEQVKERVLEMAADAMRTFSYRNGSQRRA
ncbi:MAG: DUF4157 domain-containing protein [Myxococcales bacterium]|nr:DUF4157 domain-containing protein [Myxococcales bacterium]